MKQLLSLSILLLLAAGAFAQSSLTIYGLKGPSGVGMVRLLDKAPVVKGFDVSVEALASPDLMVGKFASGEARMGILPPNVAAKLAASGKQIQVVAVVGNGMLSLVTADPALKSIKDLAGQTVEVAGQGATPDLVFRRILKKHQLEAGKDVKTGFSLAYPEIAQSLIAGRVNHALLPEPFATMALSGKPGLRVLGDIQAEWAAAVGGSSSYPMTVFVVDAAFALENPAAVEAIIEAYAASIAWVVANPDQAGALVEKTGLGIKAPVAAAAIPKSAYVFVRAPQARPALEELFRTFLDYAPAAIGGKLPADSFYYHGQP